MRKRFHRDPENGKKVSSSVGLDLNRPVPKHVLSRRGAISFSSSSSLFGAPDPRQLSQCHRIDVVSGCGKNAEGVVQTLSL
ncbi:hypothetical protein INR49_012756, partial [Caranx melampygus]